MNITMVKVYPVQEDKLKAFVSVVFDHCFMVNDIKVIQGKDGLFLSMPSRRKKSGEFKDVAHPLNNSTRRMIEERVLAEYRQVSQDMTPRRPDRPFDQDEPMPAAGPSHAGPNGGFPGSGLPGAGLPGAGHPAVIPASSRPADGRSPLQAAGNNGVAAPQMARASEPEGKEPIAASEKTLEEVQEAHLSDSFWSVS